MKEAEDRRANAELEERKNISTDSEGTQARQQAEDVRWSRERCRSWNQFLRQREGRPTLYLAERPTVGRVASGAVAGIDAHVQTTTRHGRQDMYEEEENKITNKDPGRCKLQASRRVSGVRPGSPVYSVAESGSARRLLTCLNPAHYDCAGRERSA